MKILVAVKRVVDYNVKVRVKPGGSDVDLSNLKMSMNPFCEIAVEEAVRLKEQGVASEIVVASIGDSACQQQIRSALALGADRGIHVVSDQSVSSLGVAQIISVLFKREAPQLVLLGKQAIDGDNNQTGQMLAALNGIAQGTFASVIEVDADNRSVKVTREVDGGLQTLKLKLPAVITSDLRLNEPRNIPLPNIMKAKNKPLTTYTLENLNIKLKTTTQLLGVESPPKKKRGVTVKDVDELIEKLQKEAGVL